MVFILAGIAIISYGFFDLKKSFMLYLCYKLILVTNITLISIPGVPLLTLELTMTLLYVIAFLFTGKKYQSAHMKFPLTIPLALYTVSIVISSLLSVSGVGNELSNLIKQLAESVLLVWMTWQIVETKEDFIFLFKGITVIILGSCVYGIVEYFIQRNPLTEYEATLNSSNAIDWSYDADFGRGYRVNSIFEHAIGAGMNWALYAVLVFNIIQKKSATVGRVIIPIITAILCIPCILFTNSRSPIIFFIIALLSIINFKSKRFYPLVLIGVVGVGICIPFLSDNVVNVVMSLFDENAAADIGGSNLDMRLRQLEAAFELFMRSPIFGLGPSFADVMQNDTVEQLLGSESIWFQVIPSMGLLGVIAYVVQIYYTIIKLPKKFHSRQIFFVSLAYWVTYTVTSIPGFINIMYYIFIFYYVKSSSIYQEAVQKGQVYGVYLSRGDIHYNIIKTDKYLISL